MALQVLQNADERQLARRVSVCPVPTSVERNASYVITVTAGRVTQMDKVMDGVTYRRTISYTGDPVTQIDVSVWSEV